MSCEYFNRGKEFTAPLVHRYIENTGSFPIIFQSCGDEDRLYWKLDGYQPCTSLRGLYDKQKSDLQLIPVVLLRS